jgi:asparagine synthase (glutamine-hydrolysing)
MCGVAGFLDREARIGRDAMTRRVDAMAQRLAHRGPDGRGVWVDEAAGIALGHRRLAIIDPSPAGAQPIASADGRIILSFNGEIYNYRELRNTLALQGHRFVGDSDTEVLVTAIAAWGIEEALAQANGMFAFAAWDRALRRLMLARDRLGIKPLYWSRSDSTLLFASEIKALVVHPQWDSRIDGDAATAFMLYGNVPAPGTIYANCRKLEPGTLLTVDDAHEPRITRYWDAATIALAGADSLLDRSLDAAAERVEALLRDSVQQQMIADVPLGAFLSGGIDSSLVAALMQQASGQPIKTFTIGFAESSHDESQDARQIARHLGSDHEEFILTSAAALAAVPRLAAVYDEPFADSSQLPTLLLAEMTRRHVVVALSGDGGDEVFGGYNRYRLAAAHGAIGAIPENARRAFATLLGVLPPARWDQLAGVFPKRLRPRQLGDKLAKLGAVLASSDSVATYRHLTASGHAQDNSHSLGPQIAAALASRLDPVSIMQYLDQTWYLPNDVLTKVDRASMAVGLEVRVPLLDHRIVELAWRLPASAKIARGTGKLVLRRILDRYVPTRLTARQKSGFAVPIGAWLRGPLRDWADDLLRRSGAADGDLVDREILTKSWEAHLSGRANNEHFLWNALMLRSWFEHGRDEPALPAIA